MVLVPLEGPETSRPLAQPASGHIQCILNFISPVCIACCFCQDPDSGLCVATFHVDQPQEVLVTPNSCVRLAHLLKLSDEGVIRQAT